MAEPRAAQDTCCTTLANGVRVVTIAMPQLQTASVSVFVRSGSGHERQALNGIGHVIEHMVFKGTVQRDAKRLNLDAERLGAEVNAHTDKNHTAVHMRGLARDAGAFLRMLGDIVRESTFPEAELERDLTRSKSRFDQFDLTRRHLEGEHAGVAEAVVRAEAELERVERRHQRPPRFQLLR